MPEAVRTRGCRPHPRHGGVANRQPPRQHEVFPIHVEGVLARGGDDLPRGERQRQRGDAIPHVSLHHALADRLAGLLIPRGDQGPLLHLFHRLGAPVRHQRGSDSLPFIHCYVIRNRTLVPGGRWRVCRQMVARVRIACRTSAA
jgi:hypothetical protein